MKKRKRIFLLFGTLSLLLLWQGYENRSVEIHIPSRNGEGYSFAMPYKDKRSLEFFLRRMFCWDEGGYTLFGSKPMFMGIYLKPFSTYSWGIFLSSLLPNNLRKYHGWQTFQKYQHLFFNDQRFLMLVEDNPFWGEGSPVVCILLINKELFREVVSAHIEDFEAVLERTNINSEELLLEAKTKPFLKSGLKCHNGLIGTLFGYGRENAWLFEARDHGAVSNLSSLWGKDWDFPKKIYEMANSFSCRWLGNSPKELSDYLSYPMFVADVDSSETQELKKKYLNAREKILQYYEGQDFLEATLQAFKEGAKNEIQKNPGLKS